MQSQSVIGLGEPAESPSQEPAAAWPHSEGKHLARHLTKVRTQIPQADPGYRSVTYILVSHPRNGAQAGLTDDQRPAGERAAQGACQRFADDVRSGRQQPSPHRLARAARIWRLTRKGWSRPA